MCIYVCISIAFALENTAGGAMILATLEWTDGQQMPRCSISSSVLWLEKLIFP